MFPIEKIKTTFLQRLNEHPLLILTAPPGAGKSTILPLWLLTSDYGQQKIYLLQPRRVAAKNIACYLAKQLGEPVGKTIGYRLRNETCVSKDTKIELITEGILTQIIQQDPELSASSLIIFDEFHERSVHADLAFALARDVQQGLRDDLTLLLMSATLATEQLEKALPDAHFIGSQGQSFPVEVAYSSVRPNTFWRHHAIDVIKQCLRKHQGSILVFLPGVADIKAIEEAVAEQLPNHFILAPLYGDLSLDKQQQAITPSVGKDKLVLSTNIAETSLTIEGINLVIDCGFEKVAIYDSHTLTNRLIQQPISKASAIQRAGRAGRLMPGKCIRLYSEEDFQRRLAQPVSDILQTDLLPVLIEAARWGVTQLCDLPLIELPPVKKETQAWQELQLLNIVDNRRTLTAHGCQVAALPAHPRYAHMIVKAHEIEPIHCIEGLTVLACVLTALLGERDIYSREQAKSNADIRLRIHTLLANKNNNVHQRIINQVKQLLAASSFKEELPAVSAILTTNFLAQAIEHTGELLALAYPERIAQNRYQNGAYLSAGGKGLTLDLDDPLLQTHTLVAATTIHIKHQQFISLAAPVDLERLTQWAVINIDKHDVLYYDTNKDAINAEHQHCLGRIVLKRMACEQTLHADQIAQLWCQQVQKNGLSWLGFSKQTLHLLSRWRWLNCYQQQLDLPCVSETSLLATLDDWFAPFVGGVRKKAQLNQLDFSPLLLSLLDYQQQQLLEHCAPQYFVSPTGQKCLIDYNEHLQPTASLPMQAVYGQKTSPQVGDVNSGHGVSLVLELLSPAKRPIQVTQDLTTFWQGSYQAVQKEMKGRYPKHFWPDDPANAKPTKKTKKYM